MVNFWGIKKRKGKNEEESFNEWLNRDPHPYDVEESRRRGEERAAEQTRELQAKLKAKAKRGV